MYSRFRFHQPKGNVHRRRIWSLPTGPSQPLNSGSCKRFYGNASSAQSEDRVSFPTDKILLKVLVECSLELPLSLECARAWRTEGLFDVHPRTNPPPLTSLWD